ncbi:MAG: sigma-70 family RNA polymerase sigma factor [Bacteroidota bacterium]
MDKASTSTNYELLWTAFRNGNREAFESIYQSLFPVLYSYGYRLCQRDDLVKDCIQTIFVEIWQKRDRMPEVHATKHYFLKIMRRKIFSTPHLHPTGVTYSFSIPSPAHHDLQSFQEFYNPLDESDFLESLMKMMHKAVQGLSNRKKEAIILKFYENLSYQEISEVMDLQDAKYARQLVYRALEDLRKSLPVEQRKQMPTKLVYSLVLLAFC